ncbi:uncharacterized protein LOC128861949 [Anastrepha ludens]|uniref:uncharacterized protein LOC128861949 n=1 Tax=Anastrepha ludens TaxID=28586 RepID=UPI0023AEF88C|nr:uncharacterized protein LOC128861949 [Anastrepha ludens]
MKLQANWAPHSPTSVPVVVVVTFVLCAPIACGWRSFEVFFTSFPYQYNSKLIDVKINIHNNTAGDTYLAITLQVHEDIDGINLKYATSLELDEGNFTTIVNRSVSFCKFLKQHSIEPVMRGIYEDILKQGDFIKRCPINKGVYSVHEYRIDEEVLSSYLPEAGFSVHIKLAKFNRQLLFDGTLHGNIDKSKGFNNLKMFSLG